MSFDISSEEPWDIRKYIFHSKSFESCFLIVYQMIIPGIDHANLAQELANLQGLLLVLALVVICKQTSNHACIAVPTPLEGGGDYILKWGFLFRQAWPIDIFIVES